MSLFPLLLVAFAAPSSADVPLECSKHSLANAVAAAREKDPVIAFTGAVGDHGAGVTLVNSSITANTTRDIQLTFGTRADLQTLTFGTANCDGSVLIRGTSGITCP